MHNNKTIAASQVTASIKIATHVRLAALWPAIDITTNPVQQYLRELSAWLIYGGILVILSSGLIDRFNYRVYMY